MEAVEIFGVEAATEQMYIRVRWPNGMCCPRCGSLEVAERPKLKPLPFRISQYVDDQVHTNGIESFWATLKRGYHGDYHHMSPKHPHRHVTEYAGGHNERPNDTIGQIQATIIGVEGKRLRYRDLVG